MIKKRPFFASGHSPAGLPAITRVLYSDDCAEIYSLGPVGEETSVLILCEGDSRDNLRKWWTDQPSHVVRLIRIVDANEIALDRLAAVFTVSGRYLDGTNLKEDSDADLRALFNAIIDAFERGCAIQMLPDLNPHTIFLAPGNRSICSLIPLRQAIDDEAEQVRLATKAFCQIATGVAPDSQMGGFAVIQRWARFATEELARIADRCLQNSNSTTAITTFSALKRVLRSEAHCLEKEPKGRSGASPAGSGLDKVAGMHALKELLRQEVVEPVRNPEPYREYGLSIPNGILLYGPPGCGKTYIARQLAEELGHYFVEVIPSELASPYIHQSVVRIRELFDSAAEHAPSIIFIDEFEALAPSREDLGGSQQYKSEEVNEFLAHLNQCSEKGVFVIAATNQPQKIDTAVRRTGRLDKLVYVGPPDQEARREMLLFHLRNRPIAPDLAVDLLAETLIGYSASDLQFLVDEAARSALKERVPISTESFVSSMERIQPSVPPEVEAQYEDMEQRG